MASVPPPHMPTYNPPTSSSHVSYTPPTPPVHMPLSHQGGSAPPPPSYHYGEPTYSSHYYAPTHSSYPYATYHPSKVPIYNSDLLCKMTVITIAFLLFFGGLCATVGGLSDDITILWASGIAATITSIFMFSCCLNC
jgi:hypothetical protein